MTADVAHDLRTPLSVLLGYTEALHDGKFQGSQPAYAVMHDAAQQLQRLVDDLNTLALADAGELKLLRRPIAPQALLERTGAPLRRRPRRSRWRWASRACRRYSRYRRRS